MENSSSARHIPVLRDKVMEMLGVQSGGLYVDGTVGGGGYAEAILEAGAPEGCLLALDWDEEAIKRVRERLSSFGGRLILERASFAQLPEMLLKHGWSGVDGVVVDLGVSSFHLDDPSRGFSFQQDGPLDMRMDRRLAVTAADLVNTLPEEDLAHLIYRFGEEKWARRIARAVVSQRRQRPFGTTSQLAEVVAFAVPRTRDSLRIHPATRTFQALRLVVNQELETLQGFLGHVLETLKPGGRLCVVAFHSLEDRLVKEAFKGWARGCVCPRDLPLCRCKGVPRVRLLTRRALRPDPVELERNPRARSARLRAVEKLPDVPEA